MQVPGRPVVVEVDVAPAPVPVVVVVDVPDEPLWAVPPEQAGQAAARATAARDRTMADTAGRQGTTVPQGQGRPGARPYGSLRGDEPHGRTLVDRWYPAPP
ncbi:MAG: hypothetical protein D6705_08035 [Deltaproteobacteria bacterium]|nr:MAG: hypothetical protein D6705_08035 [Deltaproteobacteria bacterium]